MSEFGKNLLCLTVVLSIVYTYYALAVARDVDELLEDLKLTNLLLQGKVTWDEVERRLELQRLGRGPSH